MREKIKKIWEDTTDNFKYGVVAGVCATAPALIALLVFLPIKLAFIGCLLIIGAELAIIIGNIGNSISRKTGRRY